MAVRPSTRFPFINLSKALDRAESLYNDDKRGNGLRMPSAFASWGYSDKSSGGFQTVGALKGYGLLVDDGSRDDRSVKLTDSARRYFMTEIEDDRAKLRIDFALSPALMRHLYERWHTEPPSDPVARSYLKTEIGLNDQSARAALGVFKDNLAFALGNAASELDDEPDDVAYPPARLDELAMQSSPVERQSSHVGGGLSAATASAYPIASGPGLNLVRTDNGYVIHLSGVILNKQHADEVINLVTALKATLPEVSPNSDTIL